MSHNEKDSLPPAYSETYTPSTSRGQTILDQLTLTRTHHIHSITTTHIIPLISQQATYGIARTTIALLPSDIPLPVVEEKSEFSFPTTNDSKPIEVIGFSSEEVPQIVRLEGMMNRTEFWRAGGVIEELEHVLQESLNAGSARLQSPPTRFGGSEFEVQERQPRRGFLSRMVPSMGPEQRSPSGNPEVGVKQMEERMGFVLVKARLEEICLRTVNEFGLYDTMAKQCVIIRVDARC